MRITSKRGIANIVGAAALTVLGGCISLLPNPKPAQLYRFGVSEDPAQTMNTAATIPVRAATSSFETAAAGDRMLVVRGEQTAYIAGARWVSSATNLFDAAVTRAFEVSHGPTRLLARDEPVASSYVLKLDVRTFEIRYDHGSREPPTVVVELYASLVAGRDAKHTGGVQVFRARVPAQSDTIGAIVNAVDTAVGKVTTDMVAWVDSQAA